MKPFIFVFDLDGTLADDTHRQHYISGENKDWKAYYAEMNMDAAIGRMIGMFSVLSMSKYAKRYCVVLTGRPEEYREATKHWMDLNAVFPRELVMRPTNNYEPSGILKVRQLRELEERYTVHTVFEDRPEVARAIKDAGYNVLLVVK